MLVEATSVSLSFGELEALRKLWQARKKTEEGDETEDIYTTLNDVTFWRR